MRKLWKGALLGGVVGAAVAGAQYLRTEGAEEELPEDLAIRVAKSAGQAALAGAVVGFVLDRRDRRRARRSRGTGYLAGTVALAEAARPHLEYAAGVARKKAVEAAEAAKPHVEHAAGVARKKAVEAAEAAKPHVEHAADVARPHVEHATDVARRKAVEAADAALPRLEAARNRVAA